MKNILISLLCLCFMASSILLKAQEASNHHNDPRFISSLRLSSYYAQEESFDSWIEVTEDLVISQSLEAYFGYRWNPYLWTQIGVGVEFTTHSNYKFGLPILLNVGGAMSSKRNSLIYQLYFGFVPRIVNDKVYPYHRIDQTWVNGWLYEAQIGYQWNRLCVSAGLRYQRFKNRFEYRVSQDRIHYINIFHEFYQPVISIGVHFN